MGKHFNHLDQSMRDRVKALLDEGYSIRKISRTLDIPHSTISRELKRNRSGLDGRTSPSKKGLYEPSRAQHKAYVRRKYAKYQGQKIQSDNRLRLFIIKMLELHWNPDEIAGHMKLHRSCSTNQCLLPDQGAGCSGGGIYASKTAIYEWLRSSWGQRYCQLLYSKRYRKKPRKPKLTERKMIPERISIHDRPESIDERVEVGHWEKDAVVSAKSAHNSSCLSVDQERVSRLLNASVLGNMKPSEHIQTAIRLKDVAKVLSITYDNGIENRDHTELRNSGVETYFTDAYSSWQKGGVENANKMLRRYFPKGTDFAKITQTEVNKATSLINQKPRKILGYKSSLQVAIEKGVLVGGGAFGG